MLLKKRVLTSLLAFLFCSSLFAAGGQGDFFQNIGKIYVVVAVVLATFIGIIIFLVFLERRIKKIEDQLNNN